MVVIKCFDILSATEFEFFKKKRKRKKETEGQNGNLRARLENEEATKRII